MCVEFGMRRSLVLSVTTLVICSAVLAAPPTSAWKTNAPVPTPFGREGACQGVVGNTIFLIAGLGPSGDSNTNSAYNTIKDTWTVGVLAPIPGPVRSEGAGVAHGGFVYCLGGRPQFQVGSMNQRYDPTTDTWTTLAPLPVAVADEYGAVVVGDQIHVIGGRTDGATAPFSEPKTSAHQVYDIASDTWSLAAPLPGPPRSELCVVAKGNNIYVLGGAALSSAVATVDIYNVAAGTWSAGPPLPAPRANAACGVLGNAIYLTGGVEPAGVFHNDTYRFDVDKGMWSVRTPKPTATAETNGVVHGGEFFVIGGGFFGAGAGPLGTVNESFKPTPP